MSDFKDVTTDQAFTKNTLYGRDGEMTYGGALSFLRRKYTKNLEGVDITVSGIPVSYTHLTLPTICSV